MGKRIREVVRMSHMMFKKRQKIKLVLIGVIIGLITGWSQVVMADEPNPLGFTVQAIRPDTQVESNKSYFFIETKPGVSQVLKVRLKGMKKEAVKLRASVANGVTGMSGNLEYESNSDELDASLEYPLTEFTQFSETDITLENFEEKIIEVTVTPPDTSYEGIKLGALVFELMEDSQSDEKKAVANNYRYRVGLLTTETGEEYEDAQNLDLVSAKLGITLGRKQVSALIHNPDPKLAEKLKVDATVTKKGSKSILKQRTVENARMAPNSTYNFLIDWGVEAVQAGDYEVRLTAKSDHGEWAWKKEFRISNDEARSMNEESAFKLVLPKWVPISVSVAIGMVILLTSLLTIRSSNWQKRLKERAKRRKMKQEKKRKKRE